MLDSYLSQNLLQISYKSLTKLLQMINYKDCSIKTYLARKGIHPTRERGESGFYLSPLRTERTPSFSVNFRLNLWYDHGVGEGGNIVELVKQMERCDLREALSYLGDESIVSTWSRPAVAPPAPPLLTIDSYAELTDRRLLGYLKSRRIDLSIAQSYCHQVNYTIGNNHYFAIGFRNNEGGWELRNNFFKGSSSPKAPTFVDRGSELCILFEGFVDMLSYLTLRGANASRSNIMVLNSVSNLKKALPALALHRRVIAFLDNDTAGRQATEKIRQIDIPLSDHSNFYEGYKDINDYLMRWYGVK